MKMLSNSVPAALLSFKAILGSSRATGVTLTLLAMLGQIFIAPHAARAADETWSGYDDGTTWSIGANWSGLAAPGSTSSTTNSDVATFNTSPGNTITIDQPGQNIGGITFDTNVGRYTIGAGGVNGGNSLLLSSGGTIQLTSAVAFNASQVFNAPLVLEPASASTAGSYTFANNSTTPNSLTFAGNISGGSTSAGVTLNLAGANTDASNVISGSISDGGAAGFVGVTMNGTGYWSLAPTVAAGANTYSGATTVNAGTLNLDYTNVPTNVVNPSSALYLGGGALTLTANTSGDTNQTFASTTLTGGSSAIVANSSGANNMNLALGALGLGNGSTIDFTPPTNGGITTTTANANLPSGSQTILGYGATVGGTTWAVSGSGGTPGVISGLADASYSTNPAIHNVNVDFPIGTSTTITNDWYNSIRIGNVSNADTGSYTINQPGALGVATGGILETSYVGNNPVIFNGAGIQSNNGVDLTIIQNNNSGSNSYMEFNEPLYNANGLTKAGAGEVILAGANSYTGTTTIDGGTLQFNSTIGPTSGIVDNAVLAFNATANTFANVISGTGVVDQLSGEITLSGANTYTGGTNIDGGTLSLGSAGALGSGPISFGGGTLQYSASNTTDYSAIIVNSTGPVSIDTNGQNISFASPLAASDTGGLTKIGAGVLTLSGQVYDYTGTTSVNGGTLAVSLGANANVLPNGGALAFGGGTLQITGGANAYSQSLGNVTFNPGASNITLVPNGFTGADLLNTGSSWTHNIGAAVNFTLNGTGMEVGAVTTAYGVIVGSGSYSAFATVGGTDWASVTNTGQLVPLSNASATGSYTADVWAAGNNTTVTIANNTAYDSVTTNTLQFAAAAPDTVNLTDTNTIITGGILVSSAVGAFNNVITGGTLEAGGNEFVVQQYNTQGTLTIGSVLADNSGIASLTTAGPGTIILNAINTYSGATYIGGGNLQIGDGTNAGTLGSTTSAPILNNGILTFNNPAASALSLSGPISGSGALVQEGAGAVTLSGALSFPGGIIDSGTGTLTLSGANSFTGGVSVSGPNSLLVTTSSANLGSDANVVTLSDGGAWQPPSGQFVDAHNVVLGPGGGVLSPVGDTFTTMNFSGGTGLTVNSGDFIPELSAPADIGNLVITGPGTRVLEIGTNNFIANNVVHVENGAKLDFGVGGDLELTNSMTFDSGTSLSSRATSLTVSTANVNFPTAGTMNFQNDDTNPSYTLAITGNYPTLTGNLNLVAGGSISNGATVINGGFSDGGAGYGLTKSGPNQLTITGVSSYTGGTTITGGTLTISAALANGGLPSGLGASSNAATNLEINGATLQYMGPATSTDRLFGVGTGGATIDSSGSGAINFTNTGAMDFDSTSGARTLTLTGSYTGGANTLAAAIGDSGGSTSIIKSGAGTWNLSGANTYSGSTTVNSGTLGLLGLSNSSGALILNASGNLNITGVASGATNQTFASLTTGSANNITINPSTGSGTTLTITSNAPSGSGLVHFDTSAGTPSTAVVAWAPAAANTLIGYNYSITTNTTTGFASVNAAGDIVPYTGGTVLTTSNSTVSTGSTDFTTTPATDATYTSNVLTLTPGASTYAASTLAISAGAVGSSNTLDLGGGTMTFSNNTVLMGGAGNYTIQDGQLGASNAPLAINQYGTGVLNISANLSGGSGSVTTNGTGIVTLSGNNSFTGGLTVASGTVATALINNAGAAGPLGSTNVTLGSAGSSGTLEYTGGGTPTTTMPITVAAGGGGIQVDTAGTNLNLSGPISGSGTLMVTGAGTLTLSGNNNPGTGGTFAGSITVAGGTLSTSYDGQLPGGQPTLTLSNGGTWLTSGGSGATVALGPGGGTMSPVSDYNFGGVFTGGGNLTVNSGDLIPYPSQPSNIGVLTITGSGTRILTGNGNGNGANFISGGTTVNVVNGANLDIGSTGSVTMLNPMTFASGTIFSERNTNVTVYTANTTFPSAGIMTFQYDDLGYSNLMTVNGNWPTLTGPLTLQVGHVGGGGSVGSLELTGAMGDGGAGYGITKTGANQLILAGANTYSGATTVSEGTILLANANALQNSPLALNVSNGVVFAGGIGAFTVGGMVDGSSIPNSNLALTDANNANVTLQLNNNGAANNVYSGVLSGGGAVSQIGGGIQTFAGANTYSGGTSVTAGTLNVNNTSGSGTGGGPVVVTGGILAGSGNIAGAVSVGGGTINPGAVDGTSILSLGSLTLDSHGIFAINIAASAISAGPTPTAGTDYDAVDITSATNGIQATLGSAALSLNDASYKDVPGQVFDILHFNTPSGPTSDGLFTYNGNALANDTTFSDSNGNAYTIYYGTAPGYGNDVVLVAAVPEPSSMVLGVLGSLGLLGLARRARRARRIAA